MLTVKKQAVRARSTEASVERLWAETWKDMGIYSRHMSDAVPGLPDRYVRGGRWVEFKSLWRARGEFTIGEGLSVEQRRTGADLIKAGDKVFYCAQIDGFEKVGKKYVFIPMAHVLLYFGKPLLGQFNLWDVSQDQRQFLTQHFLDG